MAYFFDKIKTKTLSGQDQTLQFNSNNPPSFSIGSTTYGTIVTTGSVSGNNTALTFNRPILLNQSINNLFISSTNSSSITINRSLLVTGSAAFNINNLSTNSRTLATYANLVLGGANASGQITITSDSSVARTLTLSGNLAVGTGSGSGTVTIASDTSSARVFTLGRSLTIEAGSLNTIAYNTSTTSLGAVPGPTTDGQYVLSQNRVSGVNQTPQWVLNKNLTIMSDLAWRISGTVESSGTTRRIVVPKSSNPRAFFIIAGMQAIKYSGVGVIPTTFPNNSISSVTQDTNNIYVNLPNSVVVTTGAIVFTARLVNNTQYSLTVNYSSYPWANKVLIKEYYFYDNATPQIGVNKEYTIDLKDGLLDNILQIFTTGTGTDPKLQFYLNDATPRFIFTRFGVYPYFYTLTLLP
jgi:hypothetical protein